MTNQELAEGWIAGFEESFGRKLTPEEETRIREVADVLHAHAANCRNNIVVIRFSPHVDVL